MRKPLALVLFASLFAYLNSFSGAFQFDDYRVIVNYGVVHSLPAWFGNVPDGIRPLLKLSYAINWISGAGIFGFHLINAIIHASNALLVYFIARRIVGLRAALFASLIFALHPVQTEAVTYISGRSTSMMAMFYLLALSAYIKGSSPRAGSDEKRRLYLYFVSPAFFVMAVLTKETAAVFPLALLLYEVSKGGFCWRTALKNQSIHWALLLAVSLGFLLHEGYGGLLSHSIGIRDVKANILSQINGIAYLASRLFALSGLNIDPDLRVISEWDAGVIAEGSLLFIAFAAGAINIRKRPWLAFGVLWFFLHLLPTNSFLPRLDVANERQLYLPLMGIAVIAGALADRLSVKYGIREVNAGMAVILILLGVFTVLRNRDYRSETALWKDTVRKSPLKARPYNNLGYAYELEGNTYRAGKYYLKALSLNPDYELARNNLERLERQ